MGAEAFYHQVLRLQPENPDALQLLGLLASQQGDLAAAEDWLRRSLQSEERQPHVWNNLGNVLEAQGRLQEAERCFGNAVALRPDYTDALYNHARLLHVLQRTAEAEGALQRALGLQGPTAPLLQLRAQIEGDAGRIDEALATLDAALALAPERGQLHHNRAVLLQRAQRHEQALQAHEQAFALGVDAADAHYNHGNVLQSLGRATAAVQAYRQALAREPQHPLALYDLSRLRWRLGEADFTRDLDEAAAAAPASPVAIGLKAHLLWRAERWDEAAAAFEAALRSAPDAAGFHDGLARCRARLGQAEQALRAHERALALAPGDADMHVHHAASLLLVGQPERAAAEAQTAVTLAPGDQHAQAWLGLAWRALGDPREAWLNDYERFVQAYDLPSPPGYDDMAQFNAELAMALTALHTDLQAPVDQTLRHGTQTLGNVLDGPHPLVRALRQRLQQAIDSYIAALPEDATHPFLRRRSAAWQFTDSWSSSLRRQGFHINHVHPHGWISSCYYVALPPSVQDTASHAGWIQFGAPEVALPYPAFADAARRLVQPRVGRLVLFPSMMWHGTLPFDDEATRLTIAFDVKPL